MTYLKWFCLLGVVGILSVCACDSSEDQRTIADVLYYNGSIITMAGEEEVHEALAIKDGKILAVGSWQELASFANSTNTLNLKGHTMVPGFIDGHSHFMMAMEYVDLANLWSPPAGTITDIPDIIAALERLQSEQDISEGQWIRGYGYDPDLLKEKRHPTRYDLDTAFPNHPVLIVHVSAHLAVANSLALKIMGVDSQTPDPVGGAWERVEGTTVPNGIIKEAAMHIAMHAMPAPDTEDFAGQFMRAQAYYASCGITTAQDGFSKVHQVDILNQMNDVDSIYIDIVAIVGFMDLDSILVDSTQKFGVYDNHIKLGGVKLIADGSPQGKTALMKDPYLTPVPGCSHECRGIAVIEEPTFAALVQKIYGHDLQLYTHCNGDAAIDMFIRAHESAISSHNLDSKQLRSVIVHSQFMRPDHIQKYVDYGLIPSYFTNHTYYWGDVHVRNMGEQRASFISPMRSSEVAGITYTNHTDYLITPHDQLFTIWTAVNRTSRSGRIIGPDERVTPYQALKAITINAAYQYKEEASKGSLESGKRADMVILSANPLQVDPAKINEIKVLQTIKDGKVVFTKEWMDD